MWFSDVVVHLCQSLACCAFCIDVLLIPDMQNLHSTLEVGFFFLLGFCIIALFCVKSTDYSA